MKNVSQLMALAILVLFAACADETTVFSDPQEEIALEKSESVLTNSVNFDNAGVIDIYEEDGASSKTGRRPSDQAGDYPLTLVAQISPPSRDGQTNLTASHVALDGDYAYVAYNTVEDGYSGAVDIIRISDPNNPVITGRLYYVNVDVNALAYENGFLYIAGGVDAEQSVRATSNSLVAKLTVDSGRFNLDAGIEYGFQPGFNATDVKIMGNTVLVSSGKDGAVVAYDKNGLAILKEAPFFDVRSIALNNGKIAVLDASQGISFLDENLATTSEIAIDSDFGIATKRTLDFFGNTIAVAEGDNGTGIYNADSGSFIEHLPILTSPNGVDSADIVTNGVASNDNLLFIANGGGGLSLAEDQNGIAEMVGVIELEGSINYVQSKGDYLFAAAGKAGFQIIKLNRPSQSLEAQCATSPIYSGRNVLEVGASETLAFRGSKRFNRLEIDGSLLLCGAWTVKNTIDVNSNALFEMNGTLVVASNNRRRDVTIDEGATFRVEGNLTIYGDLILNDGATLDFLGDDSVVNIFGDVIRNGNVEVNGVFRDVRSKF
ncbi:hypothetical protein N9954_03770 [Maribacter sp.]|nr:hypothetical protein [Maribacter sp.]